MSKKARRAPGNTQISISLEEGLVREIDAMAKPQNRSRSNFIVHVLSLYLARMAGRPAPQGTLPFPDPPAAPIQYPEHRADFSTAEEREKKSSN